MTIDASLDRRLRRVVRKHDRMRTHGVVHRVGRDGLIRSRPRLIRPRFPLKGALLILVLFIAFKSILYAQLGAGNYALKVSDMRQGGAIEQVGAVLMQEDRVTIAIGRYLRPYLFRP